MCVEKYTYDVRNLGQAEGAHKVANITKTVEILAISMERVALKPRRAGMGSLKTLAVFGESEATHATIT